MNHKEGNRVELGASLSAGTHGLDFQHQFAPSLGVVDYDDDRFTIAGHGFVDNDIVAYNANGNDAITGLVHGQYYAVERIDVDDFRLKHADGSRVDIVSGAFSGMHGFDSRAVDGSSGWTFVPADTGVVDIANRTITLVDHGLADGDTLTYRALGNTALGTLVDGLTYKVERIDADVFRLSYLGGNPAELAIPQPAGTHGFDLQHSFEPSDEVLDYADNHFAITGHGFSDGDTVAYNANGNDAITGLVHGQQYSIERIGADSFRLKSADGSQVDLVAGEFSGTHGFDSVQEGTSFTPSDAEVVDTSDGTIKITNHGFGDGETLVYRANGNAALGVLVDGQAYTVERIDADLFRLQHKAGSDAVLTLPMWEASTPSPTPAPMPPKG